MFIKINNAGRTVGKYLFSPDGVISRFMDSGFSGWIWPAMASLIELKAQLSALLGNNLADVYLDKHGEHAVAWIVSTMAIWLSYKGFTHHSDNKVAIATSNSIESVPTVTTIISKETSETRGIEP